MPWVTGVAQAGKALGAFSTSTRHMRQLAAIDQFFVVAKMRNVDSGLLGSMHHHAAIGATSTFLPSSSISTMVIYSSTQGSGLRWIFVAAAIVGFEFARKCLIMARTGMAAASPSAQMVRPMMLAATESSNPSLRTALTVLNALNHAPQPAGTFTAGRALATGLVHDRNSTGAPAHLTMQRAVVHHDDGARTAASSRPWRYES